jgi:regulatory protein
MEKENNTEELQAYAKAADLLDRSEHCRFLLHQKLSRRGFSNETIVKALDLLEQKGSLSDSRYALAWLRTRRIQKYEGRQKLAVELAVRGIGREIARTALDAFFEEIPEEVCCQRAVEKYCRTGSKTPEQIQVYLLRQGFSAAMLRSVGIVPDKQRCEL